MDLMVSGNLQLMSSVRSFQGPLPKREGINDD